MVLPDENGHSEAEDSDDVGARRKRIRGGNDKKKAKEEQIEKQMTCGLEEGR